MRRFYNNPIGSGTGVSSVKVTLKLNSPSKPPFDHPGQSIAITVLYCPVFFVVEKQPHLIHQTNSYHTPDNKIKTPSYTDLR